MRQQRNNETTDAAIIGGGAAGLSAALTLARARRKVTVIDGDSPRNAPAAAAHGLLGNEGINPLELLTKGREEVLFYGAEIVPTNVRDISGSVNGGFHLELTNGSSVRANQVVIATGVTDELPDIPGLAERWGKDVLHCPYCHGWEVRDQRIGVLATGPMSAEQALMFHQWSPHLWFFPNGIELPAADLDRLTAVGITIVPGEVSGIDITHGHLTGVALSDGQHIALDAVATPVPTRARLDGLQNLNLEVAENMAGIAVAVDTSGHTSEPGIWAAGNVVNPAMQVSEAAANGARVAMTLNAELIFDNADAAVANMKQTVKETH